MYETETVECVRGHRFQRPRRYMWLALHPSDGGRIIDVCQECLFEWGRAHEVVRVVDGGSP